YRRRRQMIDGTSLLEALPVAIYMVDGEGRLTFHNSAAEELWGRKPDPGEKWCGAWRLYWPDGGVMDRDESPMAVSLRSGRAVKGAEAVAERPDGSRVLFTPFTTLMRDEDGRVTGAIHLLADVTRRRQADIDSMRLAAIVASSEDA